MVKIIDLKNNLQQSELVALVYDKSGLTKYNNGSGQYIRLYLSDDSAKIQLTLFAENASKFEGLQTGKKYRFQNVYATKANENFPCINPNIMELKAMRGFEIVAIDNVDEIADLDLVLATASDTDSIRHGLEEFCLINAPQIDFEFEPFKQFFLECLDCHAALDMTGDRFNCQKCHKVYNATDDMSFAMRVKISPKKDKKKDEMRDQIEGSDDDGKGPKKPKLDEAKSLTVKIKKVEETAKTPKDESNQKSRRTRGQKRHQ